VWPRLLRRHSAVLGEWAGPLLALAVLAFRTRSWAEAVVVLGVVAGVGYWVAV